MGAIGGLSASTGEDLGTWNLRKLSYNECRTTLKVSAIDKGQTKTPFSNPSARVTETLIRTRGARATLVQAHVIEGITQIRATIDSLSALFARLFGPCGADSSRD